jgi:tripartite-type tricarboxylate transporter receptor subunit TctC
VRELVDAAKAKPKSISVSIGSTGSSSHMFVYTLERLTAAHFNVVVMKSGGAALTALLGGHVQWHTGQLSDAKPHLDAGKLRILGIASQQRVAQLPDIPTLKEQGLDMNVSAGRGFSTPAGIPADAKAFLEKLFANVYKSADWQDYMRRNMMEPVYMDASQYGRYLAARQPEFSRFITELGLAGKK